MTINQSTNNAESYLVLICRGFFYWGRGVLCVCLNCLIMLVSINMFKTLLQPTAVYNEKLRIASNGFHLLGYLKFVNLPNVIDFVSEY